MSEVTALSVVGEKLCGTFGSRLAMGGPSVTGDIKWLRGHPHMKLFFSGT